VADYGNAQKFSTFPRNTQMPGAPQYGNEYMGGSNFRGNAGAQQNKCVFPFYCLFIVLDLASRTSSKFLEKDLYYLFFALN